MENYFTTGTIFIYIFAIISFMIGNYLLWSKLIGKTTNQIAHSEQDKKHFVNILSYLSTVSFGTVLTCLYCFYGEVSLSSFTSLGSFIDFANNYAMIIADIMIRLIKVSTVCFVYFHITIIMEPNSVEFINVSRRN